MLVSRVRLFFTDSMVPRREVIRKTKVSLSCDLVGTQKTRDNCHVFWHMKWFQTVMDSLYDKTFGS